MPPVNPGAALCFGRCDPCLQQPLQQRLDRFEVEAEEAGRLRPQDFPPVLQEGQEEFVAIVRLAAASLSPKRVQARSGAICR